jgi:hypothetical protein
LTSCGYMATTLSAPSIISSREVSKSNATKKERMSLERSHPVPS